MKKILVVAAALGGLGVLGGLLARKMRNIDWERRIAAMPDDFPPKWMFRNVATIRENTERILEALDADHAVASPVGGGSTDR